MLGTLEFPLRLTPQGTLATVRGSERVLRGVALYFVTPQGSRPLVPEFGVPDLPTSPAFVPSWAADVEGGIQSYVWGVTVCRVLAGMDEQGRVRAQVYVRTDGAEEIDYDVTLSS